MVYSLVGNSWVNFLGDALSNSSILSASICLSLLSFVIYRQKKKLGLNAT